MSEHDNKYDDTTVIDRPPQKESQDLDPPPRYAVILLNDDYTPMDFVVLVLTRLFNKTQDEAEAIMTEVHEKGKGLAGCYSHDVAETKVSQVNHISQVNKHPFKCALEPVH
jgi:ATP-dependent Clp protease adaptor protein ClpS